ncbi:MAG: STAS domain-containing protein [Burkholderiales bacterium]
MSDLIIENPMAASLALPTKLVVTTAREELQTLVEAVDGLTPGDPAVVDGAALAHFDTSALAVLLSLKRHCLAKGRRLEVRQLPQRLTGLAQLYGVAELV